MNTVLHQSHTRGHANYGWLDTHYSFSFANYYNPARMNFGALRVLNDDIIAGGGGFGTHPHDNMEIISIPIYGALAHKDSMGNIQAIRENEIQVMSAGSGITHSEFNHSKTESANFLQLWIFPNERNVTPRYDQKSFVPEEMNNAWQRLVSPKGKGDLWIHQDAYVSRATLGNGISIPYAIHTKGNGIYFFVISGEVQIEEISLKQRDALGVTAMESMIVKATQDAIVLAIEVPMEPNL